MKTRLERQIEKQEQELQELKSFAKAKLELFQAKQTELESVLKRYNVNEFNYTNCFVDKSPIDGKLIFRMYVGAGLQLLTSVQKKNVENKLRDKGFSMPICPISPISISFVYSQE